MIIEHSGRGLHVGAQVHLVQQRARQAVEKVYVARLGALYYIALAVLVIYRHRRTPWVTLEGIPPLYGAVGLVQRHQLALHALRHGYRHEYEALKVVLAGGK